MNQLMLAQTDAKTNPKMLHKRVLTLTMNHIEANNHKVANTIY